MALWSNYKQILQNELRGRELWRDVICELVATFCLESAQCALPLSWDNPDRGGVVQIALGMGFVVTILIEAFGPLSGAHMNPAVTISMAASGMITVTRGESQRLCIV